MGGHFCINIAAWTLLCLAILRTVTTETDLVHDLGLNVFPDASKINISLDEYTKMMGVYLAAKENSVDVQSIPKLITFDQERRDWWASEESIVRLKFPVNQSEAKADVESAQLRLLLPPQTDHRRTVTLQAYQIIGKRKRRFLGETPVFLGASLSKWCELDVTSAVSSWLDGERNLGVELVCTDCRSTVYPLRAAITALLHPAARRKRSPEMRPTDCQKGPGKRRCCRHEMQVDLKLILPKVYGVKTVVVPEHYDAGFCQGLCPKNYNHATNHSRIQSLMHQINRRKHADDGKTKLIPKACCAPTKLRPLDILRVDPDRPDKLMMETWNNMEVVECSCS